MKDWSLGVLNIMEMVPHFMRASIALPSFSKTYSGLAYCSRILVDHKYTILDAKLIQVLTPFIAFV
jgi:hypothetical protein